MGDIAILKFVYNAMSHNIVDMHIGNKKPIH